MFEKITDIIETLLNKRSLSGITVEKDNNCYKCVHIFTGSLNAVEVKCNNLGFTTIKVMLNSSIDSGLREDILVALIKNDIHPKYFNIAGLMIK